MLHDVIKQPISPAHLFFSDEARFWQAVFGVSPATVGKAKTTIAKKEKTKPSGISLEAQYSSIGRERAVGGGGVQRRGVA